jgi:hypothetical protein
MRRVVLDELIGGELDDFCDEVTIDVGAALLRPGRMRNNRNCKDAAQKQFCLKFTNG